MLIRLVKSAAVFLYFVAQWALLPVFMFMVRRSKWKDDPAGFARALANDPQVVKWFVDNGQAGLLATIHQKIATLVANASAVTQEEMEHRYPVSIEATNDFLLTLRGATVLSAFADVIEENGEESERLFQVVTALRGRGCGVLYVSHRLDEVLALALQPVSSDVSRTAKKPARQTSHPSPASR